ncbi:2-dehydropantoate 2-reductase [Brevundimonas aurifodinae]|uniref:2-dehydropantoate 2-reductase n=2 Tax=Brevundimonas TaxID=41275 RepID=A0ABV1NPG9_9CAUL|nr:MAG: 2-dehydropantoate 2-reductase [Brevundimonas sp. 12-68-7]OYX35956.1 MAG: 2-dehydropantoate 2-reductase [Brevundimonas subvibrioides]
MTVAVVGPGAIGGTVAAHLIQSGLDPVLCARTPFDRLVVHTPAVRIEATPRVVWDPSQADPVDWVLIATKTYDVAATALWLDRLVGPATRVAVLQNGVEHVTRFAPHVPADRIVPVVVEIPAERSAPGVVVQRRDGWMKVPTGANGAAFAALFDSPDLIVSTEVDWTSVAWAKLAVNCAGAVSGLTGRSAGVVSRPDIAELMRDLVAECLAVGTAEGAVLSADLPDRVVAQTQASPPDSVNSLLADRRAGRPTEWDARNGVIARLGRKHGIPTPLNAMAATLLAALD